MTPPLVALDLAVLVVCADVAVAGILVGGPEVEGAIDLLAILGVLVRPVFHLHDFVPATEEMSVSSLLCLRNY